MAHPQQNTNRARTDRVHYPIDHVIAHPFYAHVSMHNVLGFETIHKFGANESVGTTYEPITTNGLYNVPQVSGAVTLRVKAGDANDTDGGSGAWAVQLEGLDVNGKEATEVLRTNGISAGTPSTTQWLRVYRAFVTESGTYATQSAGSHAADIVIEDTSNNEWARIIGDSPAFPRSQSQIACYSVPVDHIGYVTSIAASVESGKAVDIMLFKREQILQTAAPYEAMRAQFQLIGLTDQYIFTPQLPMGPFTGPCDLGWMGKVGAQTAKIEIDFELIVAQSADGH